MLIKKPSNRNVIEFVSLDAMVPEDHLLRKIDAVIDFDDIYDIVKDLYCEDNGRPSINPVVLFKIVLIQHIWHFFIAPYARLNQYEYGLQMVSWLCHQ